MLPARSSSWRRGWEDMTRVLHSGGPATAAILRMEQRRTAAGPSPGCKAGVPVADILFVEQPGVNVIGDGPQPRITDRLAVDAGHVRGFVPHDRIAGNLVAGFVRHSPERMPQGVEAKPMAAVDAQLL